MTLAERIRAAMKASGVSQAELARACDVKPPSVNGWLSGKAKFLRGENLLKAARALGVSQDWLATGRGSMSAEKISASGSGSGGLLTLTCETLEEYRLLTAYRLASEVEKGGIDAAVEHIHNRLSVSARRKA